VAAITGASAGIGAATARALVGAGAKVAVGARRNDRLASLVGELGDEHAVALPGDVRDPQYNEALVAVAVEKWGRLDTVVANAGIGAYGGILDIDDAQLREMVETNYLATVWTVRSGVRQFRAHAAHYNAHRPHRALGLEPPDPPADLIVVHDGQPSRVCRRDLLGGLLHEYHRRAG
jgi:NADP-dependent 3-hydroxy acid dehydrogenase YdfG